MGLMPDPTLAAEITAAAAVAASARTTTAAAAAALAAAQADQRLADATLAPLLRSGSYTGSQPNSVGVFVTSGFAWWTDDQLTVYANATTG
jgi:hypothetical protein